MATIYGKTMIPKVLNGLKQIPLNELSENITIINASQIKCNNNFLFNLNINTVLAALPLDTGVSSIYKTVIPNDNSQNLEFSRNSSATRVNSQGIIETVPIGQLRIDYTETCPSILLEHQRTNIQLYNTNYTQGLWSTTRTQVFPNSPDTLAPDGTFTANRIRVSLSGNPARLFYPFSSTGIVGTPFVASSFVKPINTNTVTFRISNAGETRGAEVTYNFDTNTFSSPIYLNTVVPNPSNPSENYLDVNNMKVLFYPKYGWYRICLGAVVATGQTSIRFSCGTPGESTAVLDDQIFNWGAQIEFTSLLQEFASSVILTDSTALTRLSDNLTIPNNLSLLTGKNRTITFNSIPYLGSISQETSVTQIVSSGVFDINPSNIPALYNKTNGGRLRTILII